MRACIFRCIWHTRDYHMTKGRIQKPITCSWWSISFYQNIFRYVNLTNIKLSSIFRLFGSCVLLCIALILILTFSCYKMQIQRIKTTKNLILKPTLFTQETFNDLHQTCLISFLVQQSILYERCWHSQMGIKALPLRLWVPITRHCIEVISVH